MGYDGACDDRNGVIEAAATGIGGLWGCRLGSGVGEQRSSATVPSSSADGPSPTMAVVDEEGIRMKATLVGTAAASACAQPM